MKYRPGDWVIFSGALPQEYRDAFDETWRRLGRMQVVDVISMCRLPGDEEPREALVLRVGTSGSTLVRPEWVIPWVPDLTPFIRQVKALAAEYLGAVKAVDVEMRSERPILSLSVRDDVFRAYADRHKLSPECHWSDSGYDHLRIEIAEPNGWRVQLNTIVPSAVPAVAS